MLQEHTFYILVFVPINSIRFGRQVIGPNQPTFFLTENRQKKDRFLDSKNK